MSFQPNKIMVGPARIFLGSTAPTSGTPPNWIGHTAGVPADGTEAGLTENDTVFMYEPKKTEIQAEQYYAPIGVFLTLEACKLTFTAQESTVIALQAALDNTGQFSDGTKDAFYIGAGTGAFAVKTQTVFFSARQRVNTSKYIIGMMYLAYASKGLNYVFSRTKKGTYAVELTGIADTTRTPGDAVAQFYIEK